jgi:hypothetical protein
MERLRLIVVLSLVSIAHLCIAGTILLVDHGVNVPGALIALAGTAVGALAGILVPVGLGGKDGGGMNGRDGRDGRDGK